MAKYHITAYAINHKGCVRNNNEDNLYINGRYIPLEQMDDGLEERIVSEEAVQLYAVCDGMGGEEAGEVASFAAVSHLSQLKQVIGAHSNEEALQKVIVNINRAICDISKKEAGRARTGTTLTAVAVSDSQWYTINIGDSRVYLFRGGCLQQMTKDHSEVQRMMDMGFLSKDEAKTHPKRHELTRHLGMSESHGLIEATLSPMQAIKDGDVFLLCSDGLTDMLDDETIATICAKSKAGETLAKQLSDAALAAGGQDNITILVVAVKKRRWRILGGISRSDKS